MPLGGASVGSAYVTIVPTFKGGVKAISNQLNGIDASAAGEKIGKDLTNGASKSFGMMAKNAGSTAQNVITAFKPVATGIGRTFDSAASGVLKAFSTIGKASVAAAGVAGAGIAAIAPMATSASDTLKRFENTMSFAGYDGGTIKQAKADLQNYADSSVYSLQDVMNTAAQLGANGVQGFDRVTEALGNLNMAAGGNAQSFSLAAQQLVQMNAAGKVTYADWKIFAQDMPGGASKIKDELKNMGAYQGDFNDALSQGQISSDEFNQALLNLGFTDVAQQAANSSTTVEASLGQIQASVEKTGQTVFDSLVSSGDIQKFTDLVTGAISDATPKIVDFIHNTINNFKILAAAVSHSGVIDAIKGVADAFKQGLGDGAPTLAQTASMVGKSMSQLAAALKAVQPLAEEFGKIIGDLAPKLAAYAPQILAAAIAVKVLGGAFKAIETVKGAVGTLSTAIGKFKVLQGASKSAGKGVEEAGTKIGKAGGTAGKSAPQMLAFGGAIALIGAGIGIAAFGMSSLATALGQLGDNAAPIAGIMAGIVGIFAGMAVALAALAPSVAMSTSGLLALGGAVALIGVGIGVAAAGLSLLAGAMAQMGGNAPLMAVIVGIFAGMTVALAALAPVASSGAVGLLALGAAVILIGAGVGIAALGISQLATAMASMGGNAPVMAVIIGIFATMTVILAALSPVLSAGALGLIALGIAALGIGTGVMIACTGIATLINSITNLLTSSTTASNIVQGTFDVMYAVLSGIFSGVASAIGAMVSAASGFFNNLVGVVSGLAGSIGGVFSGIVGTISGAMDTAKGVVRGGLDAISGFFSGLHLEFPHISLPHFSISGSFSLDPPSVPSIGVDWYANGGVFGSPTVIGVGDAAEPEYVGTRETLVNRYGIGVDPKAIGANVAKELRGSQRPTLVLNIHDNKVNDNPAIEQATQNYLLDLVRLGALNNA
jgi:tape measure domain-containing protein